MSRQLSKAALHAALDESRAHLLALYANQIGRAHV